MEKLFHAGKQRIAGWLRLMPRRIEIVERLRKVDVVEVKEYFGASVQRAPITITRSASVQSASRDRNFD